MSRGANQTPQFDRMIRDLERAKHLWLLGDNDAVCRILRAVGSIATVESFERGSNDPIPEIVHRVPPLRDGMVRKGGQNPPRSQISERPPAPPPFRPSVRS
jgi:hypothetical protein